MYVGARVKELRRQRGWTLMALANRAIQTGNAWLTYAVLESIERAAGTNYSRRRRISVDDLVALATALHCRPVDLLPGHPEDAAAPPALDVDGLRRLLTDALTHIDRTEAPDGRQ